MKCIKLPTACRILFGAAALLQCFFISAQNWTIVQGIQAQDIAAGKNGSIWATGVNSTIYRWNGSSWETMPGGASRIAVEPDGAAWVVNAGGQIYKYNLSTRTWDLKPGGAKDIGAGADGSIWVIGMNGVQGGYEIYKWNGSGWNKIPGGAVRIAVDPSGNAWIVNNTANVFTYNGSSFVLRPGQVKDIGIGADGTIWCTGTDDRIYKWNSSNWQQQTGGASQVTVAPDGNAWVVNASGQVWHSNIPSANAITVRTIFPRGQTYEYRMLKAMKVFPYASEVNIGGSLKTYAALDPLGQAFGKFGLTAAEIYFVNNPTITADQALGQIGSFTDQTVRRGVSGILAVLLIHEIQKNNSDAQTAALKTWSADLFRSIKVRSAKAVLDEYNRWKGDWCTYEGISPEECRVRSQGIASYFSTHKPPQDLLGMNGLHSALAGNADAIAVGVSLGLAAVVTTGSAIAVTSGLGVIVASTIVNTAATPIILGTTSLCTAFGGSGGIAGAAGGAIGAASWAGVVAAPVAAAVLCIVVGTIEGFAVVEAAKVEPTLKMKLGAAMTEHINITNAMADSSSRDMFFIAFQEAAENGYQVTQPRVDGEVRFYCQAGYVSRFSLSYTANGQNLVQTTPDLPVGQEKSFTIPYNATNISVKGEYSLLVEWREIFNQTLASPTYICYTSYGTAFEPRYKTDCPEVGNMVAQENELTVTHGGGYAAWVRLTYTQNGQTVTAIDQNGLALGWRRVFTIPGDASNIHLQAWDATGLVWEPWKTIIDKTWPVPPNACIKVYGTTLEPKWNQECN